MNFKVRKSCLSHSKNHLYLEIALIKKRHSARLFVSLVGKWTKYVELPLEADYAKNYNTKKPKFDFS